MHVAARLPRHTVRQRWRRDAAATSSGDSRRRSGKTAVGLPNGGPNGGRGRERWAEVGAGSASSSTKGTPGTGAGFQDELGNAFLQPLHDWGRVDQIRGPQKQVAMFGHEHVADETEPQFGAPVGEGGDKLTFEPVRIEEASAR